MALAMCRVSVVRRERPQGRAVAGAKGRAELRAEGRAEGGAKGGAKGRAEGRAEGRAKEIAEGRAESREQRYLTMSRLPTMVRTHLGYPFSRVSRVSRVVSRVSSDGRVSRASRVSRRVGYLWIVAVHRMCGILELLP
jgi:hypothetical protein